jgi:hypothetical protein
LCLLCCRVLRIELAECREEVRKRDVEVAAWHQELNRITTLKEKEHEQELAGSTVQELLLASMDYILFEKQKQVFLVSPSFKVQHITSRTVGKCHHE